MRERLGLPSLDERAQTEVLGFALLFGTILFVILLVTATATGSMLSAREDRQVANAEVAMSAFAGNVDDLTSGEAPSRSTQFGLEGGRLSLGEASTLKVTVDSEPPAVVTFRPLVYRAADGTELIYLNGAVVRDDGHGNVTIDESTQVVSGERVSLTLVNLYTERGAGAKSIGGDSTVSIGTVREGSAVVTTAESVSVTLELTSPYAAAWAQSLEDQADNCTVSGNTATCTFSTVDRLTVSVVDVKVRFD
jgi:hypothetical protein